MWRPASLASAGGAAALAARGALPRAAFHTTGAGRSQRRALRTPQRHRLSDVRATPPRTRAADEARPGELPPLEFASPGAAEDRAHDFASVAPGLQRMLAHLLGRSARPTVPQAQALAYFAAARSDPRMRATLIAAETGSGKTLAYLLPVLQKLHDTRATTEHADVARVRAGHAAQLLPRAVVLAPTHELARQISAVAKALCHDASHKLRVSCTSTPAWDAAAQRDVARLADAAAASDARPSAPASPDVLVSTPARLLELLEGAPGLVSLANVQSTVVDEADTLLDTGFAPETAAVLAAAATSAADAPRDAVFVSATIPRSLSLYLAKHYPKLTTLASPHLHRLPPRLRVMFVDPGGHKELAVLKEILRVFTMPDADLDQILIFRDKRTGVQQLSNYLRDRNVDHVALTGDADARATRTDPALGAFLAREPPAGSPRVLITTSLLSRGLDFGPHVRHVFLPDAGRSTKRSVHAANNNALELLHRAGRSARAGREGTVVVFDRQSAPGRTKVLLNRRGQKRGVVRGQMDLLVSALRRPKRRARRASGAP